MKNYRLFIYTICILANFTFCEVGQQVTGEWYSYEKTPEYEFYGYKNRKADGTLSIEEITINKAQKTYLHDKESGIWKMKGKDIIERRSSRPHDILHYKIIKSDKASIKLLEFIEDTPEDQMLKFVEQRKKVEKPSIPKGFVKKKDYYDFNELDFIKPFMIPYKDFAQKLKPGKCKKYNVNLVQGFAKISESMDEKLYNMMKADAKDFPNANFAFPIVQGVYHENGQTKVYYCKKCREGLRERQEQKVRAMFKKK